MIGALAAIALKSFVIAGATLALLWLLKGRSAAERSWVAHVGLVALVLLAFAPLIMPSWTVEMPALFPATRSSVQAPSPALIPATQSLATAMSAPVGSVAKPLLTPDLLAAAAYGLPAALLLLMTALALGRLIALRARADVLVDGHWLSALARAQRRMGFKHGTALLTSDDLASPISWGLMRPVILLNNRAVEAAGEAEAIIAHELAHVARMDWAKLLLARIATALFWFNPLVWILAREAHQLREETADDAVLAADIDDTDYAQLLVGIARHDCPGLLLGAHGVAPSKSSLCRRIARVLDHSSMRGPAARPFALGVFAGAVLISAPLAALTLIPRGTDAPVTAQLREDREPPALARILATGVQASVNRAVQAVAPADESAIETAVEQAQAAREAAADARIASAAGRATAAAVAAGARTAASATRNGGYYDRDSADQRSNALSAVGATPDYVAAMRAASPAMRRADADEFVALKAVGVTPAYVREIAAAGFGNVDPDELTGARATGLTGRYISAMKAEGVRGDFEDFNRMHVTGITPAYVRELRRRGMDVHDADRLMQSWPLGEDVGQNLRRSPSPPRTYNPPPLPVPPSPPDPYEN